MKTRLARINIHAFPDQTDLVDELAATLHETLVGALKNRESASLVLPGGKTPIPLLERLSWSKLPWEHVKVTTTDERWVPPDDDASNEKLIRAHLLKNEASDASLIGLYRAKTSWRDATRATHVMVQGLPLPYDAVVLGMGTDGHTASLFPRNEQFHESLDSHYSYRTIAATTEMAVSRRISQTVNSLLLTGRLILYIVGYEKWEVFTQACKPGPLDEYPIRAFLFQHRVPVEVFWCP